jgi:hypothetical protein
MNQQDRQHSAWKRRCGFVGGGVARSRVEEERWKKK